MYVLSTQPSHLSVTGGTHSGKSYWIDGKKSSSSAVEPEANIEFREKKMDEDAGSIKEGGDLGIEPINVIDEKAEDQRDTRV